MMAQLCVMLIAVMTAVACSLPGVFLVLRGISLMSDAISHSVLFGIVIMFFLVQSLSSPLLFIGAVLTGLLVVVSVETLLSVDFMKKDSAIALVFPFFFSMGTLLISVYARTIHLDIDMVLLGEIIFAPFNRLIINQIDYGPVACWQLLVVLLINSLFMLAFYKQLLLTSFDYTYARVQGVKVKAFFYGLMAITSITTVAAFDIVGSVMTVALIICPAAISYLLVKTVPAMFVSSIIIASITSIIGCILAHICNISVAGMITSCLGVLFFIVLLCSYMQHNVRKIM